MATMRGYLGSVKIGGNTVAEVRSWTMSLATEKEDVTPLGSAGRVQTPTYYSATGSITCSRDNTDTNGQVAMTTAALAGSSVTLLLYESATKYWTVPSYIDYEETVEATGIVGATYTFTSNSTVSYT